ncbi:MAG: 5'-methylthioadenosine/adenosylhomocysteine nucleosidase [Bacilli bacterium]|jgi:adenosylhomocysteine nucleosidase|nr:5'-methylthioadenosine/adenosylhomocysteine nucleosidase [Bacilli bacterium]
MKHNIAVIGAMKEEITFLLTKLEKTKKETVAQHVFYTGTLFQHSIVLVESGVGKVASGITTAILMEHYPQTELIINVGVAGGVPTMQIGDIVVGDNYVYGDVDISMGGNYRFGQMARCPFLFKGEEKALHVADHLHAHIGTICTVDRFVVNWEDTSLLLQRHFSDLNILCFDMESTAFAQSAYFFNIPFLAIRAISDIIGSRKEEESFQTNMEKAAEASNQFLYQMLEKL